MIARGIRERIAIGFLAAALVLGAVLGVMTVRSLTQPGSSLAAAQGDVSGQQQQASSGATNTGTNSGAAGAAGGSNGAGGGTITIGGFFDITGPIDSSVERDTVRSYMQAVNGAGGINGRQVQYVWCDSKYDASAAVQCANYLIAQHVVAVVGLTAPLGEDNAVPILTNAGIPVIGGLGTPNEYGSPLAFPVSTSFYRYGTAIADEAKAIGAKHPAVVVLGDVPWVHPVEANLLNRLTADGIGYTDVEEVSATQASYTGTVFNLQHSHHGPSGGGAGPNYSCPPTDKSCPDFVIAFLSPYDHQGNATVRQYLGTVQHFYPGQFQALDIYTQHAWTAAMLFVDAARRAGANLTSASLVQALDSTQNFNTGWSVPLSYGAGAHDPNHCFTYTADNGSGWHTTSGWICS